MLQYAVRPARHSQHETWLLHKKMRLMEPILPHFAGLLMLEVSVVVFLLQGYLISGREVCARNFLLGKKESLHPAAQTLQEHARPCLDAHDRPPRMPCSVPAVE